MRSRAAVLGEMGRSRPYARSRPLEISDVELDDPGPGELLVRIEAAGICHSDLSVIDGSRPRPLPMALGHEAAGVVERVGEGVDDVAVGDRVVLVFVPACGECVQCHAGRPVLCPAAAAANGAGELVRGGRRLHRDGAGLHHHLGVSAFSDHAVVDRRSAVVVPGDIPATTAALFGCAVLTGAGAVLTTAGLQAGQSVAVFGLGGVGLAAVMAAAAGGASAVVAVDPVAAKRDLALQCGATAAVSPDEGGDALAQGADITVEAVGSAAVLDAAWRHTARGGITVAVGLPHPAQQLSISALQIVAEARTLRGSYMGDAVPQRDIPRYIEMWRSGALPVEKLLSGTLKLDDVNEAMDRLADGAAVRQVIVPG